MKKILVTGGSGYIGARLCLHLANKGYAVTPLCHSKIPEDENWVSKMDSVIVGDVRDEKFLSELAENKYDVLIHLVSLDHNQSNGTPSNVSSVNITPVWSLLDIFSKKGLQKFLYFSTAQVYGTLQEEAVTEVRKTNTQNAYGLTHHIGEIICEYYNRVSSAECCVVRLSNSYGAPIFNENNCWWLVINDLCKMAFTQKEIVLQSDGTPLRDFIHGWDVCRGVEAIIETSEPHLTYNLSSGSTLSIMEIALKIKEIYANRYGEKLLISSAINTNKNRQQRYLLDNSLLLSIGFEPKWTLESGINDLFDFLEKK
ncbi:NAD-dependent epimerase/dehydratase family protein [Flavobacterium sp. LB3P122]|uniref:NAD-dependent epimerase/dehydratase family protein n=1 Tax=Flavobacterium algoriphilum TaxID=3398738 RepID=UPI003A838E2C